MFDWIKQLWRIKRIDITARDAATIRRILAKACGRSFNSEVVLDITTGPMALDTYGERIECDGHPAEGFYMEVMSEGEVGMHAMNGVTYEACLAVYAHVLDENQMDTGLHLKVWIPIAAIREMTCSYARRPDPRLRETVA